MIRGDPLSDLFVTPEETTGFGKRENEMAFVTPKKMPGFRNLIFKKITLGAEKYVRLRKTQKSFSWKQKLSFS